MNNSGNVTNHLSGPYEMNFKRVMDWEEQTVGKSIEDLIDLNGFV